MGPPWTPTRPSGARTGQPLTGTGPSITTAATKAKSTPKTSATRQVLTAASTPWVDHATGSTAPATPTSGTSGVFGSRVRRVNGGRNCPASWSNSTIAAGHSSRTTGTNSTGLALPDGYLE